MSTMIAWTVVVASEVIALFLLRRIWRSGSHLVEKVALTLLVIVPVLGPLFASWLILDPGPAHPAFRDRSWSRDDVLIRWKHVFDEKDSKERQKKWQEVMDRNKDGPV